jgi:hypothetical protein
MAKKGSTKGSIDMSFDLDYGYDDYMDEEYSGDEE